MNARLAVFLAAQEANSDASWCNGISRDSFHSGTQRLTLSERVSRYPLPVVGALGLMPLGATDAELSLASQFFSMLRSEEAKNINKKRMRPEQEVSLVESTEDTSCNVDDDYGKMTHAQLKSVCLTHGLLTSGTKVDLQRRVQRAVELGRITRTQRESSPALNLVSHDGGSTAQSCNRQNNGIGEESDVAQAPHQNAARTAICVQKKTDDVLSVGSFLKHTSTHDGHHSSSTSTQSRCVVSIVIDRRERSSASHQRMLDAFYRFQDAQREGGSDGSVVGSIIKIVSRTLVCGDFAFTRSSAQSKKDESQLPVEAYFPLIVERKTLSDLLGSVTNNHLNEQKELLYRSPFRRLLLIVEGSPAEWQRLSDWERRRAETSLVTAAQVDEMHVLRTGSLEETVSLVNSLACAFSYGTTQPPPGDLAAVEAVDSLLSSMRRELRDSTAIIRMLSAVHGVSARFLKRLLRSLEEEEETTRDEDGGSGYELTLASSVSSGVVGGDESGGVIPPSSMMGLWLLEKYQVVTTMNEGHSSSTSSHLHHLPLSEAGIQNLRSVYERCILMKRTNSIRGGVKEASTSSNATMTKAQKRSLALLLHFVGADLYS